MASSEVSNCKRDWYQTESHVIITIFVKNVQQDAMNVDFNDKSVDISIKLSSSSDYVVSLQLAHTINPNECSFKIYSTKVEIKLKKKEGFRWESLECDGTDDDKIKHIQGTVMDAPTARPPSYPSSSLKKHDWNKLEAEVNKEEEKPEGEAALNQLFQKIYSDGGDEVKKAMNKSFMESGGTVLSTNWGDIKQSKVDVKAPDGMEWKKWEK